MDKQTFIRTAKEYLEMGFSVIPFTFNPDDGKKIPFTGFKWAKYQTTYPSDDEIERWAETYSNVPNRPLNIAIVTGHLSNLVVIDIDSDEGLTAATDAGVPTENLRATSGKGVHLYCKFPKGKKVGSNKRVLPRVDIRGDAGLIIAPPSSHPNGGTYEWQNPLTTPLGETPQWVIDYYNPNDNKKKKDSQSKKSGKATDMVISEGGRNDTMFKKACELRTIMPQAAALAALGAMNIMMCTPPLDDFELEKIIESAYGYETTKTYNLTDAGNAERFFDNYADRLKYINVMKTWVAYQDGAWRPDESGITYDKAVEMARAIPEELPKDADSDLADEYRKFARRSENTKGIEAMLKQAQGKMALPFDRLDSNPWLLNLVNGTFDLKKMEFRNHCAEDYISKVANVEYNPSTQCPIWESFIDKLFGGDAEVMRYFQKALGYTLSGSTKEQKFFILYGEGENGKTTLLETVGAILGDYGTKAEFNTFTTKLTDNARNDIAAMAGKRYVFAAESNPGKELDSSLLKELTGGDTIKARFLFKEYFTFKPPFKIFLATNHKPKVKDDSKGMWRRMKCIPCTLVLKENEKDLDLPDKLYAERVGILNWILEGYKLWVAEGLKDPKPIQVATEHYRDEMDVFGRFLNECCDITEPTARTSTTDLYGVYMRWCQKSGEPQWSQTVVSAKLEKYKVDKVKSSGRMYYRGIRTTEEF